mgnify:CR=1 FL=1
MILNELRDKAYQCAIAHGWHEEDYSDEHFLCLIISELMEAVQADRKDKRANVAMFKEWQGNSLPLSQDTQTRRFKEDYEGYIKGSVEEELADACIRIFDFTGLRGIYIHDFTEEDIDDFSQCCNNETFAKTIYAISTIPIRVEYEYDFQLKEQLNGMLLAIFGLAKHINIDILWHIENKMRYNELRPYKHGKRY